MGKNIQKSNGDKFDYYYGIWKYLWWGGCIISMVLGIIWRKWTFIHSILLLFGITLAYVLSLLFKKYYKPYPYKDMRNLVIETLKQVGCQPEIDKKDESHVGFMYQGEHFFISIENECLVTFYNTWWGSLDLNNPDIGNLKEAINLTNAGNIPKVLYTTDTQGQKLGVHSMYRVFLKKEIPALPELFKAILNDFFEVQKEVKGRFNELNDEKVETNQKERVKVKGFGV